MKKRRIKRGRALSIATLGLAAVSLVSVGFSAWIIQVDSVQHTTQITATVAEVTNQSLHIAGLTVTDHEFNLDAADGDDAGQIIASNSDEDYSFSITFNMTITDTNLFKGIGIKAHEKINKDAEAGDATLNALSNDGGQINMPVPMVSAYQGDIFNADTNSATYAKDSAAKAVFDDASYCTLIDKSWLPEAGKTTTKYTLFTDSTDGASDATSSGNYNRLITITRGSGETANNYSFAVSFSVKWGTDYLGFNPSLCDGADDTVNAAFETADKTMPLIGTIEDNLNALKKVSGNGLFLELIHSPTKPYSFSE